MEITAKTLHRQAPGFTLVELMVALALSLFLIGGVLLMYTSGRAASLDAERLSRVQENIRFASDYLVRDIRNAGFRDQMSLWPMQFRKIGESYAEIADGGNLLIIRYTGWGTCSQKFAEVLDPTVEPMLVENHYYPEGGNLMCRGIGRGSDGETEEFNRAVAMVGGLNDVSFEFIMPDGVAQPAICDFHDRDDVDTACIGVRINLEFQGEGNDGPRTAMLTAAFRNVIVDQVFRR